MLRFGSDKKHNEVCDSLVWRMTSFKVAPKMQTVDEKNVKKSPLKPQDTQDNELHSTNANILSDELT